MSYDPRRALLGGFCSTLATVPGHRIARIGWPFGADASNQAVVDAIDGCPSDPTKEYMERQNEVIATARVIDDYRLKWAFRLTFVGQLIGFLFALGLILIAFLCGSHGNTILALIFVGTLMAAILMCRVWLNRQPETASLHHGRVG